MIQVTDKKKCCGCEACVQICPKQCIRLAEDQEGFLYPCVDEGSCITCGRCEKVCPELNLSVAREPLKTYAAKNTNENIRMESSSGGIFTLLAEAVIHEGGVVFGARFDEKWRVMHDYTETKEGLKPFRGSKYVQSRIGNAYRQAEQFLRAGRKVLFTGTPCQIAGLKLFLRKEYDNLLAVDFVCHGVPSPKVWRTYLDEITGCRSVGEKSSFHYMPEKKEVENVEFRSKSTGWKKYSFVVTLSETIVNGEKKVTSFSSVFTKHPFMQAFLSDLILRPSCYACPVKSGKSGSDITIGDFWGIDKVLPDFDDDKGVSLVMFYTNKIAKYLLLSFFCKWRIMSYDVAKRENPSIENVVTKHLNRDFFFRQLKNKGFMAAWHQTECMEFLKRLRRLWYRKMSDLI